MRGHTLITRLAAAQDAPALADLIHHAFEAYRGRLVPPSGAHAETADSLAAAMARGAAFLSEGSGVTVACIFAERRPDRLYIGRLAVDPAWRGRGLGRAMLAEAEQFARGEGYRCLELGVRLVLSGNIRLFQAAGFRIVGQRSHPGFSMPTYHVMEKRLD